MAGEHWLKGKHICRAEEDADRSVYCVNIKIDEARGRYPMRFRGEAQYIPSTIGNRSQMGDVDGTYDSQNGVLTFSITYPNESGGTYTLVYHSNRTKADEPINGEWGNARQGNRNAIGRPRGRFEMTKSDL
jgi:hypothetical protein